MNYIEQYCNKRMVDMFLVKCKKHALSMRHPFLGMCEKCVAELPKDTVFKFKRYDSIAVKGITHARS